jgi:hypothetical protein
VLDFSDIFRNWHFSKHHSKVGLMTGLNFEVFLSSLTFGVVVCASPSEMEGFNIALLVVLHLYDKIG